MIGLSLLCLGVGVAVVPATPASHALSAYVADVERADIALAALATARDPKSARSKFLTARIAYKRIEWLAEHYTPLTAAALNGPAVDQPDEENPKVVVRPTGLQVIEAMLYRADSGRRVLDSVAIQARIARVNVRRVRERLDETVVTDAQLFDAARMQVARIVTLGIAGFDTPLSATAMPEAAASILAMANDLSAFGTGTPAADSLQRSARLAAKYLAAHPSFERLDRFAFITQYANPLAKQIGAVQRAAGVARLTDPRPWLASANTVFDRGAFDAHAFAPPGARRSSPQLVALGERLFNDTRLSNGNNRSCASCHALGRGFGDGQRVPSLIAASDTVKRPRRNTPTLYNAALQAAVFADARVAFLEDQVSAVVNDPREMGGNLERTAASLHSESSYRAAFTHAFGAMPARGEMSRAMRGALAAYMRSLVRLDSRFDRAMRGEEAVLAVDERRGFNLFMGKARCGTCHFAPLFNGTVPPGYTESEVEIIGVPDSTRGQVLDPDRGAGASDKAPLHDFAFKTPTVRNVVVSAPYMHNGVFRTLAEVVDFYDAGGGAGLGLDVPNQTLPADSLHLTRGEKRDLVAFMRALTDTSSATK